MDNEEIAQEWFSLAEFDLKSAIFLLDMKPRPLEIIAYHCQQTAEKLLKGFVAFNGGELKKTHDLLLLNRECQRFNEAFSEIFEQCIRLTDYAVQVRYPFQIDLNEQDIKIAIKDAQFICSFVQGLIKPDMQETDV